MCIEQCPCDAWRVVGGVDSPKRVFTSIFRMILIKKTISAGMISHYYKIHKLLWIALILTNARNLLVKCVVFVEKKARTKVKWTKSNCQEWKRNELKLIDSCIQNFSRFSFIRCRCRQIKKKRKRNQPIQRILPIWLDWNCRLSLEYDHILRLRDSYDNKSKIHDLW